MISNKGFPLLACRYCFYLFFYSLMLHLCHFIKKAKMFLLHTLVFNFRLFYGISKCWPTCLKIILHMWTSGCSHNSAVYLEGEKKNKTQTTTYFSTSPEDYCYHTALFCPVLTVWQDLVLQLLWLFSCRRWGCGPANTDPTPARPFSTSCTSDGKAGDALSCLHEVALTCCPGA